MWGSLHVDTFWMVVKLQKNESRLCTVIFVLITLNLLRFLIPSNLIKVYWHAVPKCLVSWLTIIISCKIDLWGNVLLNQAGVATKNQAAVPLRTVTHTVANTTPCINPFTTILTIYMYLHTKFYIGMFVIVNSSLCFQSLWMNSCWYVSHDTLSNFETLAFADLILSTILPL